jgi:hypothetical protein
MVLRAFLTLSMLLGCAACSRVGRVPVAPETDGARFLARCERQRADPDVTSWNCGNLTAVEAVVSTASDRDVTAAFDGFAATFGGDGSRRVDSNYASGAAHHTAMRIEGRAASGEAVEARMVAVRIGGGVRLYTCSSRASDECGPVLEHLVQGVPGASASRSLVARGRPRDETVVRRISTP